MPIPTRLLAATVTSCITAAAAAQPTIEPTAVQIDDASLQLVLSAPDLATVAEDTERFRFQIIVTTVDDQGRPSTASLRADAEYFYPASTIKLCAAVAALQKVQAMRDDGIPIDLDSPLTFHPLFEGQELESEDDSNVDGGSITLGHEIRKLFIVSDNRAFNRLYEFVGQQELNQAMWDLGLDSVRISHRLSTPRSAEQNRITPRIDVALPDGRTHTIPERTSGLRLSNEGTPGLRVGAAVMSSGEKMPGPKDFTFSNRISLADLHALTMDLFAGDAAGLEPYYAGFLREAMRETPGESENPSYPADKFPDEWVKFMLPGVREALPGSDVVIYNKIGLAYGFTTDTALVHDRTSGRGFFVTATLYTNDNGVLNDNVYEYETVAFPFWHALGYELANTLMPAPPDLEADAGG